MDPDYEDYRNVSADISKRPLNSNSVEEVEKKVAAVLDSQLSKEITGLESDIFEVDKRLNETKLLLDRLRAAILISYYDRAEGKTQGAQQGIHPAVQTEISKCGNSVTGSTTIDKNEKTLLKPVGSVPKPIKRLPESISTAKNSGPSKTKHRIVVGNVSKYIPVDSRQKNDQVCSTCRRSCILCVYIDKHEFERNVSVLSDFLSKHNVLSTSHLYSIVCSRLISGWCM